MIYTGPVTVENGRYISQSWPVMYDSSYGIHITDGASKFKLDVNHIHTDSDVASILNWARSKMIEEQAMKAIVDSHPALQDLKSQFDAMYILIREGKAPIG